MCLRFNLQRPLCPQCNRSSALKAFSTEVFSQGISPDPVALIGCGCSEATEAVAEISHLWNISQVCIIIVCGYTALYLQTSTHFLLLCLCSQISAISFASYLSDRKRFKNFFRTDPSAENFVPGLFSVLQYYGWHKVHFLTQCDRLFTEVSVF